MTPKEAALSDDLRVYLDEAREQLQKMDEAGVRLEKDSADQAAIRIEKRLRRYKRRRKDHQAHRGR